MGGKGGEMKERGRSTGREKRATSKGMRKVSLVFWTAFTPWLRVRISVYVSSCCHNSKPEKLLDLKRSRMML